MIDPSRVRFTGPLTSCRDDLWANLRAQGYTPLSARSLLYLGAHLSRWLMERDVQLKQLSGEDIDAFVQDRRKAGYTHHITKRSLDPILCHLGNVGIIVAPKKTKQTPLDAIVSKYGDYLVQERAVSVIGPNYQRIARQFMTARLTDKALDFCQLTPADVTSFILEQTQWCSVSYAKQKVTALRSFLRFLQLQGAISHDLVGAVPSVPRWRLAGILKGLRPPEIKRLFASCDRRTSVGRRDYAVLLFLGRLGLRAGEVARLELSDIHWATADLFIRGKGGRHDRLPLPHDVGEAIAGYLKRGRPETSSHKVFVQAQAPYRDLKSQTVTLLVRAAGRRAGLGPIGAHQLRHTVATLMLQKGASLSEIAQVLRHRSVYTTALYAKVDRGALRTLARPWPGGRR